MWLSYLCIITALPFFTCVPISYSYKDFWKLYDYPLKLALLNLNNILKALSEVRLYLGVRNFNIWNLWWSVAKSCLTLATPPTVARPAPLSTWNLCTCVLRCSSCVQLFVTLWIVASFVHGVPQARILEWITMLFSRGSSQFKDWTCVFYVSCIGRQVLYH